MKTLLFFALLLLIAFAWGKTSNSGHVKLAMLKYAAEKKRHEHELKSRGGNGSGHGGNGNGSGNGGNGSGNGGGPDHDVHDIDWRRLIRRTCGIDIHHMNTEHRPVEPMELSLAVNNFSRQINATAAALEVHRPNTTELAQILEAGDMSALRTHMGLFDDFRDTLKISMEAALCSFLSVYKLGARLEMEGGSGFSKDQTCDRAVDILGGLLMNCNWDLQAAAAMVACNQTLVAALSTAITGDVECIISDIRDLGDYTAFLATGDLTRVTIRQIQVAMGSVQNWGTLIMHEVVHFAHAAEHLVDVIHSAIDSAPTCPSTAPASAKDVQVQNFNKAIKQLQHLLSAIDVK